MKKAGLFLIGAVFLCLCGHRLLGTSPPPSSSSERASAWTLIGPQGGDIRGLARNPKTPSELYAVSYWGQVFRTSNNGSSWTRTAVINDYLEDVELDPKVPTSILILGDSALYRSENRGGAFTKLPFDTAFEAYDGRMAVHPTDPKIVYVAGYYYSNQKRYLAIAKTVNGGAKWTYKKLDATSSWPYGRSIAICAKSPSTVYFCGYYYTGSSYIARVYRSSNSGGTWKNATPAFLNGTYNYAESVAVDPKNPNKAYLSCYTSNNSMGLIAQTSNSGSSWTYQAAPSYLDTYTIVIDKTQSDTLYAGGYNQSGKPTCFRSVDGGGNWTELQTGLYGRASDILVSGSTIHFASDAGIFRSMDGGANFTAAHKGIKATDIQSFALLPASSGARQGASGTIYAAANAYGNFKSVNMGGTWKQLCDFQGSSAIAHLAVPRSDPNRLYLSTFG
jgi:photosystem II stability/assembly factor-like uncharacterized protein